MSWRQMSSEMRDIEEDNWEIKFLTLTIQSFNPDLHE